MDTTKRKDFLINVAYWAVILAIIFLFFKYLIGLFTPFLMALIYASVTRPLVRLLSNKLKFPKSLAAIVSTLFLFSVIGFLFVFFAFRLGSGISQLFFKLPEVYKNSIEPDIMLLFSWFEEFIARFDDSLPVALETLSPKIIQYLGEAVTSLSMTAVTYISGFAARLPSFFVSTLISIIATFFMAVDYDRMSAFILRQIPESAKTRVNSVKDSIVKTIGRYGRSYLLIMLMTFCELLAGLLILGVENAVLIAAMTAVIDIIPVFGTGFVLWPWAAVCFIQQNFARGFGLLVIYVIISIVRQIMEPRIVGKHVGMHPLVTLTSMFVGVNMFGLVGFFGLPITLAILVNLNENGIISFRRVKAEPKEEKEDTESGQEPDTPHDSGSNS